MAKKLVVVIAVLIGVIVVGGLLWWPGKTAAPTGTANMAAINFPEQMAGLTLQQPVLSGEEAKAQIGQLHGTGIAMQQAYIANYKGQGGEATLWISLAATPEEAAGLLARMDAKMPASQVFTGYQVLDINGRQFYRVEGMGQSHYYFQVDKKVYWVSMGGVDEAQALHEVLAQI